MTLKEAIDKADGRFVKTAAGFVPLESFREIMRPFWAQEGWTFALALCATGKENPPRMGTIKSTMGPYVSRFPV